MSTSGGSSGGSTAGALIVRKFSFAFNSSAIGTGHTVYIPTIGDILHDAWIQTNTAWNGTTPQCDIGTVDNTQGLYSYAAYAGFPGNGAVDMTQADTNVLSANTKGPLNPALDAINTVGEVASILQVPTIGAGGHAQQPLVAITPTGNLFPAVPLRFVTASPILVWVTQTGAYDGAATGATQGAAVLYLVTSTPT